MRAYMRLLPIVPVVLAFGCSNEPKAKTQEEAVLIKSLSSHDAKARLDAAAGLGKLRSAAAVPHLIRHCVDVRQDVHLAVIRALGQIGDESAIPTLCKAIKSDEWETRRAAIEALGAIGGPKTVDPLMSLLSDKDTSVAMSAAMALANAGVSVGPRLAQTLEDKSPGTRAASAYALGRLAAPDALPALRTHLDDSETEVRLAVAEALARLKDTESADRVTAMLKDKDRGIRAGVAKLLPRFGDAIVPKLAELLSEKDDGVRESALAVLAEMKDKRAVSAVLLATSDAKPQIREKAVKLLETIWRGGGAADAFVEALRHENAAVRLKALQTLQSKGHALPESALIGLLSDKDADLRAMAIPMLVKSGAKEIADAVAKLLKDENSAVSFAAAGALANMGDLRGKDVLMTELLGAATAILAHDPKAKNAPQGEMERQNDRLRRAQGALGTNVDARALEPMLKVMALNSEHVSPPAARVLGCIGGERAFAALMEALEKPAVNVWVRGAAAEGLGRIGDPRAMDPMVKFVVDTHRFFQGARDMALRAIIAMDKKKGAKALAHILEKTENFNIGQIRLISQLLAETDDVAGLDALIEVIKSDLPEIRKAGIDALRNMATRFPAAADTLIAQMKDSSAGRRTHIAAVLSTVGAPILPKLAEALKNPAPEVRNGAAWALGFMNTNALAATMLLGALDDGDPHVRSAAAWGLGQHKASQALDPLLKSATDSDANVRSGVAEALGQIGGAKARDSLLSLLADENEDVRSATIKALSCMPDERAIYAIQTAAEQDKSSKVKNIAAETIEMIRRNQARQAAVQSAQTVKEKPAAARPRRQ